MTRSSLREALGSTCLMAAVALLLVSFATGAVESLRRTGRLPAVSIDYSHWIDPLLEKNDYLQAIPQLQMALQIDLVNEHVTSNNLGNALAAQGQWKEAAAQYRRALEARPRYATAHYNLAKSLAFQGNTEEAMAHYQRAIELEPKHGDAHNNLGNLLTAVGRNEDAIRHYRKALEVRPDYAEAHNNLGWALKKAGRLDEALVHFREASRQRPELSLPMVGTAWILATHPRPERRNLNEALRQAQAAAKGSALGNPLVLDTLAVVSAAAGEFERAARVAEQAMELAGSMGHSDLAAEIEARLDLYRQGRPYLERMNPSPR